MATPAHDPIAEMQSDIQLIRDQVDELQLAIAEKRAAWYKQPSTLISVVALAVSTVTSMGAYYVQQRKDVAQDQAEKLAAVSQLATEIIDTGKQMADLNELKDPAQASYLNALLNNKREIMVARATDLVDKLQLNVSPEILYTLGSQEHLSKGRQQFDAVVRSLADKQDENGIYQRAYTYELWGNEEFINDQVPQGKEAFANARKNYELLSPANPSRQTSFSAMATREATSFMATSAAAAAMKRLVGTWRDDDGSHHVALAIALNQGGTLSGTMSASTADFGPLAGPLASPKLYGVVTLEDDTLADFTWTIPGVGLMTSTEPTTVTGKLRLDAAGRTLQMQYTMSGKEVSLVLKRT